MDPLFWDALFLSLRVAALASGILLLAGAPLAWLLAFRRFPGKALLEAVFLLPWSFPHGPGLLPPSLPRARGAVGEALWGVLGLPL